MSYIRINNENNLKEVKECLSKLGVSFDVFDYSLEVFFNEEAEYRLGMWEDEHGKIEDTVLRNKILSEMEDEFFDSEIIICGDKLDDLTRDIAAKYID